MPVIIAAVAERRFESQLGVYSVGCFDLPDRNGNAAKHKDGRCG